MMKYSLKKLTAWISMVAMLLSLIPATVVPAVAADATSDQAVAAVFSDMNEVEYTEAVSVTGGIGLFAGTDGKFMPKGTVTRAQMATIVVKMLYGANANADSFKGASNPFTDTANFEGGWAEGYINWCYTLGIISGYGDGTFRPGNKVTAAEAVTMILNALKIDAGEGTWPTTVMAKATEVDFFEDLKPTPAADLVLNREQLAVISLNGLGYSAEDGTQFHVVGGSADEDMVFDAYADAQKYADKTGGTVQTLDQGADSLAQKVFGLKSFTGYVVDNKATMDADYTVLKALDGATEKFDVSTELDQIGHYVTVWYKEPYATHAKKGLTYSLSEAASYVKVDEAVTNSKEYKEVFEQKYELLAETAKRYSVAGDYTYATNWNGSGYTAGSTAAVGTYVIEDENSLIVGFIAEPAVHTAQVKSVSTFEDETVVILSDNSADLTNNEDKTQFIAYEGIAKEDLVSYVQVRSHMTILSQLETVTGKMTKYRTNNDGDQVIVVDGNEYTYFGDANGANSIATGRNKVDGIYSDDLGVSATGFTMDAEKTYVVYLAPNGKYVGFEESESLGFDASKTVYLLGTIETVAKEGYGTYNKTRFARGINLDGDEVMLLTGVTIGTDKNGNGGTQLAGGQYDEVAEGFYTFEDNKDSKDTKKYELQTITPFNTDPKSKENPVYAVYNKEDGGIKVDGGYQYGGYLYPDQGFVSNSETLYLVLDNVDVKDDEPIYASLSIGKVSVWQNKTDDGKPFYVPGLVTKVNGAKTILAMILTKDSSTAASDAIYVSRYNQEPTGITADGAVYAVYNASTGAAMEVTLQSGVAFPEPGFYGITRDLATRVVTKVSRLDGTTKGGSADGFKNNSALYNTKVEYWTGSNIKFESTVFTDAYSTAVTVVVDPRTDEQIKDADGGLKLGRVASLNDLLARGVLDDDFTGTVKVDVFVEDSSAKRIRTIFISDVAVDPVKAKWTKDRSDLNTFAINLETEPEPYELLGTDVDKADLYGAGKLFATFDVYKDEAGKKYVWVTAIDKDGPVEKTTLAATIGDPKPTPDVVIDPHGFGITKETFADNTGNITYNYYDAGTVKAVEILAVDAGEDHTELDKDELDRLDLDGMEVRHDIPGVNIDEVDNLLAYTDDQDKDGIPDYDVSITLFKDEGIVRVNKCARRYNYAEWTEPASGTYKLGKHYKVNSTIQVTGDLTIDLNGRRLELGTAATMFDVKSGGTLTINNSENVIVVGVEEEGTILGKEGNSGTLINVASGGNLVINGGTITGNKASVTGGAIANAGTVTINDGKITNNESASHGGAISSKGTLNINGGTFTGNKCGSGRDGNAVYVNGGTATVTGGTFTGNDTTRGTGAFYVSTATATITGGTFAADASGNVGVFGNTDNPASLTMGGSANVGGLNVYGTPALILSTLSEGASIAAGKAMDTTNAFNYAVSSNYTYTYSATENLAPTYAVTYDANGGTGAPAPQTKDHGVPLTLSGGVPTPDQGNKIFAGWDADGDGLADYYGGDIYTVDAVITLVAVWEYECIPISVDDFLEDMAAQDGTITLDNWYKLTGAVTVSDDLTVDLNGARLTLASAGNLFVVSANATLTIKDSDSKGRGTVMGLENNNESLIKVEAGGELVLEGVTITGNKTTADGGAINSTGKLTITGGMFSGNESDGNGGAIYVGNGGTVAITGTKFTGNSAGNQGGAIYFNLAQAAKGGTIEGANITGNFVDGAANDVYQYGKNSVVEIKGETMIDMYSRGSRAEVDLKKFEGDAKITFAATTNITYDDTVKLDGKTYTKA